MNISLNKSGMVLIALSLLMLFAGCIKNKVRVIVNEDGSGNIVVSRIFAKEVVDGFTQQMEEMEMQMPASVQMPDDPFYNEEQIKNEAGQYGPGVEFLKSKKYSRNGSRGYVAVYKFADVNDIFINLDNSEIMARSMSPAMPGMEETQVAEKGENAISFELESGEVKKLRVDIPDYPAPEADFEDLDEDAATKPAFEGAEGQMMAQQMGATSNPYGLTGKETRGEIIKKIMNGLAMSFTLELRATEQESNADHSRTTSKGGKRYVMLDMDMDKLLADEDSLRFICEDDNQGMGPMSGMMAPGQGLQFYSDLNGRPGMTVQTNDFVVSFDGSGKND